MNMKKATLAICLLLISQLISSCGAAPLVAPTPTQTSSTGTVEGTVYSTNVDPQEPLAGATVILFDAHTTEIVMETETDASGRYSFSGIQPGIYDIGAQFEECFVLDIKSSDEDRINITPGIMVAYDITAPCGP